MKIRNGFVSNSSSSSFIIGCKEKPTKELMLKILGVPKTSFLYSAAEEMAKYLSDVEYGASREGILKELDYTIEELKASKADWTRPYLIAFERDWSIFEGSACNEGEGAEYLLCDMSIKYEDDNIIIYKDGGF